MFLKYCLQPKQTTLSYATVCHFLLFSSHCNYTCAKVNTPDQLIRGERRVSEVSRGDALIRQGFILQSHLHRKANCRGKENAYKFTSTQANKAPQEEYCPNIYVSLNICKGGKKHVYMVLTVTTLGVVTIRLFKTQRGSSNTYFTGRLLSLIPSLPSSQESTHTQTGPVCSAEGNLRSQRSLSAEYFCCVLL